MGDFLMGYKSSLSNILFVYIILFLFQFFYNILQLKYRMENLAQNQNKKAPKAKETKEPKQEKAVLPVPEIKEEQKPEKKPEKLPDKKQAKSKFAAGSIIDFAVPEPMMAT